MQMIFRCQVIKFTQLSIAPSNEMSKSAIFLCFLIIFILKANTENVSEEPSVLERIKSGFQKAGNFLGLDAASELAQMVMETFKKTTKSGPSKPSPGILAGFLKLLSFDTSKISAIVMNSFVFIAQLIVDAISPRQSLLTESSKSRSVKDGTPVDWILSNPSEKLKATLDAAQNRALPESIIKTLKTQNGEIGPTVCTQLLICKTSPFIWKMQETLSNLVSGKVNENGESKNGSIFMRYLPKMEEYLENSQRCEESHFACKLTDDLYDD